MHPRVLHSRPAMKFASIVFTACLAILSSATPTPEKRQSLAQVITRCTVPNHVALTFDDGPYYYLYDISKALVAANSTGTFFFNGNNYGCIYSDDNVKRVKYAYAHGHQVASHTWYHKNLATLSWDQIHDEMWRVELALKRITGAYPAFMRPPYGSYNNLVRQASYIRGQKLVLWDLDIEDSLGASPARSKQLYDQRIASHPSTMLVLNHEVHERTAHEVVPYAIQKLKAAGYKLVTVAECLGLPRYQSVGAPGVRDSSWHC
jgi:peptidoglycan/xylan/chitin deacetylase (PgdA/CDA1 family)